MQAINSEHKQRQTLMLFLAVCFGTLLSNVLQS